MSDMTPEQAIAWLRENGRNLSAYYGAKDNATTAARVVCEHVENIRAELTEARRLLDDARAQKPTAWRPKFDIEGDWSLGEPSIESIEYWHGQGLEIEYAYLRSAPVPAQPAAVPEAVAKDAAAILVQALEEIAWQRPLGVRPSKSGEAMERAAIIALHKYNALLSAADTEVKNG